MVPSTVDPDAAGYAERANKNKKAVKISAWKLAKLDSNEAIRAAAKARASSSVLRPIDAHRAFDADFSSSDNASVRSSLSIDYNATREMRSASKLSPLRNCNLPSETSMQGAPNLGSPAQKAAAPSSLRFQHPAVDRPPHSVLRGTSATPLAKPMFQSAVAAARDLKQKPSVVWDQEAGRFVSVPASAGIARDDIHARTSQINRSAESSTHDRKPALKVSSPLVSQQERLMYTERSIFFGGPLLSEPARDRVRHASSSGMTIKVDKESNAAHEERESKS